MELISILLLAAMPFSELRGAIPIAMLYGLDPIHAYILCVAANLLPILPILVALKKFEPLLLRMPIVGKLYRAAVRRVERRKEFVERYGYLGLTLFVAVPLPVTGAWTGSLIAFLLRLDELRSFAAIAAGVAVAGAIVLAASLGVLEFLL